MALLDNLQFDPLLYGGQGGSLLDMIRTMGQQNDAFKPAPFGLGGPAAGSDVLPQNAQPTAGQNTIAVGDYQMPRIGFGSPMDANAQMPAAAAPSAPAAPAAETPSPGGDFGDRLLAGFQGFANSKGLLPALANGISGFSNGNQTQQFLMRKGLDAQTARTVASNPTLLKTMLPQLIGAADKTNDVKNYEYGQKNPAFVKFLETNKADGQPKFGVQPQYGVDANGNPVIVQLGNNGTSVQTKLPDGVSLSKQPIKMDAGTHYVLLDPITRQQIGIVQKDLAGAEAAKAKGKAQGAAQFSLPTDLQNSEQTVTQIDDLIKHPGLSSVVGPLDQFRPSWTMGDSGRDALARYNQLKGHAFLQAYTMLKGGGQITEVEGTKAENAMARMDRAQSEEDFKQALTDFRDAVKTGMQKMREKAGVSTAPAGKTSTGVSWKVE